MGGSLTGRGRTPLVGVPFQPFGDADQVGDGARNAITSRSRGVSESYRLRSSATSVRSLRSRRSQKSPRSPWTAPPGEGSQSGRPRVPERSLTGVLPPGCLRPIDRLQQGSAAEGLMEESDRPRLQRACANFGVRVCRDEDDWNRQVACGEMPLKLQPVHSRQTDVEDQASGVVSRWRSKKSFRGRENLGGQIGRIHQARQGVSNHWIVIDDGDRKVLRHTAKRQSRASAVRHCLAGFYST